MANPVIHFEIIGKDPIPLQKFYADNFGWKMTPPVAEMGYYSLVDKGDQGIPGGIGGGDSRVTVYIAVPDLQACLDRIAKDGAEVVMPVTAVTDQVSIAMFKDPSGNIVGLMKS